MRGVLQYLTIILTAVLGVLGVATDFRNKRTKKVTRGGKFLFAGILLSASITLFAEILDQRSNAEKERRMASTLEKVVTRFTKVEVGYEVVAPIEHVLFKPYVDRLAEFFSSSPSPKPTSPGHRFFDIAPTEAEPLVQEFLRRYIQPSRIKIDAGDSTNAETLVIDVDEEPYPVISSGRKETGMIQLGVSVHEAKANVSASRNFTSVSDLSGSRLAVRFGGKSTIMALGSDPVAVAQVQKNNELFNDAVLHIRELVLTLRFDKREFKISNFTPHVASERDSVSLEKQLPTDISAMERR